MTKRSHEGFARFITVILLIVSLTAFSVLVLINPTEAQHNNPAPVITVISPDTAEPGTSVEIYIYGNYFLEPPRVYFFPPSGIKHVITEFIGPEELLVSMEIAVDAPLGYRDVTIINPDQQSVSLKAGFKIKKAASPSTTTATSPPAPVITGLSSNEITAGKMQEVTVYGNNFSPESSLIITPSAGINLIKTQVSGSEEILAIVTVEADAQTGFRDITVYNPDQQSFTLKGVLNLVPPVTPSPATTPPPTVKTTPDIATSPVITGPPEMPATSAVPTSPMITPSNKVTEQDVFSSADTSGKGFFQKLGRNVHGFFSGLTEKVSIWWQETRVKSSKASIEDIRNDAFSLINKPDAVGTPCLEPSTVNYRTLYVATPPKTGKITFYKSTDGSAKYPFLTIADALAKAEELNYEAVEIHIARGSYDGNLNITRPTKLIGENRSDVIISGTVTNTSIYSLTLDTLSLHSPDTISGDIGLGGALSVSNICASTTLWHVDIDGALNYGIIQNGGKLNVSDVYICDISAAENDSSSGTTMHLTNVDAALSGVVIERSGRYGIRQIGGSLVARGIFVHYTQTKDEYSEAGTALFTSDGAKTDVSRSFFKGNRSSAIIIQGSGTETSLRNVCVYNNKVNPWLLNPVVLAPPEGGIDIPTVSIPSTGFASVEARQEALLVIDHSKINDNEYLGLRVTEGAQARVTDTTVSRTVYPSGGGPGFAVNIQSKNGGYIYLGNVTCSHADLGGLHLYDGTADYHVGEVSYCPVGVNIAATGFDVMRLMDRVAYAHNGVNLQAETLPVPGHDVP